MKLSNFAISMALLAVVPAEVVHASCNTIPSAPTTYPSILGEISSPFGQAGKVLTISREVNAFSATLAENEVFLTFHPPGGPSTQVGPLSTIAPEVDSSCTPDDCTMAGCRCVRFEFPDTDALVGAVDDDRGLTGPVEVSVETGGVVTATIEPIFFRGSTARDNLTPTFIALPDSNPYVSFTMGPAGDMLGAVDGFGNLFVPAAFAFIPPGDAYEYHPAEIVDIESPELEDLADLPIESFTVNGARLPPLIRRREAGNWIGTADFPESVLRLEGGEDLPGISQLEQKGPVVIPGVTGSRDPRRRAHPFSITTRGKYLIYENRECVDIPEECFDVNEDSDLRDYFLYGLDISDPDAEPFVIDEFDAADFAGYPGEFDLVPRYTIRASEEIVAFAIQENATDLNLNGEPFDLLRAGAYDLERRLVIAEAAGSPHMEVDGSLLALTILDAGKEAVHYYDASDEMPAVTVIDDESHAGFYVRERDPALYYGWVSSPFDLAVKNGLIAFAVDEAEQLDDLNDDMDQFDQVVHVYSRASDSVMNLMDTALNGMVRLTDQWLLYDVEDGTSAWVAVRETANLAALPASFCSYPFGYAIPAVQQSDDMLVCLAIEPWGLVAYDFNDDGDFDDNVAHVLLPNAIDSPEYNLGMAIDGIEELQLFNGSLALPVDETNQGQDLDGDGMIGGPTLVAGPYSLLIFDGVTQGFRSLLRQVGFPRPPFFNFFDDGALVLTPQQEKGFLRDLDQDARFEDPVELSLSGEVHLDDNCPEVPNRDQRDTDEDGIGDLCEDPVLLAGGLLLVRDATATDKRKLKTKSVDDSYVLPEPATYDDPTVSGATLRITNPASSETAALELPESAWEGIGDPAGSRGYKFDDGVSDGTCIAKLGTGKFTLRCRGTIGGFTLDESSQGALLVELTTGSVRNCMRFGGTLKKDSGAVDEGVFQAKNAPAPVACE